LSTNAKTLLQMDRSERPGHASHILKLTIDVGCRARRTVRHAFRGRGQCRGQGFVCRRPRCFALPGLAAGNAFQRRPSGFASLCQRQHRVATPQREFPRGATNAVPDRPRLRTGWLQ
jgi:hypothetical protein